jgi:hypothetical protein
MAAPQGNRFWEARTSHGPPARFTDPEVLWKACTEYFTWVEENPLWENKVAQFQGSPVDMPAAKMRAMTIGGLCLFLDITHKTWIEWRSREDICEVVTKAEEVIRNQKFSGAAADLLNANIIARDLGLKDETKTEHSGHIDFTNMTDTELDAAIQRYLAGRQSA